MSGSLLIQAHGWRGIARDPQLFLTVYTAGFVSVGVSRFLISDRMRDLVRQLIKLTGAGNSDEGAA